jgi:hypothetical protein
MSLRIPGTRVAALAFAALFATGASAASKCDRACLEKTLDQYLNAVLKHAPASAPLDASFRYTENAMVVKPGEGLWKSARALGKVQRRYFDPVNESAAYFGHIEEAADASTAIGIATLRVHVVNRKITEAELVIGQQGNGILSVDGLTAHPPPQGPVPSGARSTRKGMVAAANSYFDGLQNHDGSHVLQQKGCVRVENGVTTAGHPADAPGAPAVAPVKGAPPVSDDCGSGMEVFKATIAAIDHRRFPVVDERAGVVLGMVVFNRPPGAKRPDGSPFPRNLLTEIFAMNNDRIQGIYAAMHYMVPDLPDAPGW